MACVLAEAERLYGEYGIPFFTLSCALTEGKKCMKFPTRWQNRQQAELRARNKNAVCVRTGQTGQPGQKPLVVVDADGDAALGTSNGDNGKTTFTTLIRHTLGDYALGSSAHDPHALVFTLTEGEAPQVKGGRLQVIRQSSLDTEADGAVAVRFDSTFVASSTDADIVRRVFPRVLYTVETMMLWAPYHFLLMLESLREFRQKAECPSGTSGYVYCFSSASMPGIVKIGATKRDPSERLREANAAGTWRPPLPYELEGALRFVDAFAVESAIHVRLAPHRVNPRREFFRVAPDEVMRLLREYD